jgi:hypothetical protein
VCVCVCVYKLYALLVKEKRDNTTDIFKNGRSMSLSQVPLSSLLEPVPVTFRSSSYMTDIRCKGCCYSFLSPALGECTLRVWLGLKIWKEQGTRCCGTSLPLSPPFIYACGLCVENLQFSSPTLDRRSSHDLTPSPPLCPVEITFYWVQQSIGLCRLLWVFVCLFVCCLYNE